MKVFFRRIHLYLGLVSGLFLVVVCLTGTLLVFEEEMEHAFHRERYFVAAAATPRLSLAQLTEAVRAAKPKAKINGLKVYADPGRSVEISLAGSGSPGGPQGGGREGQSNTMREQGGEGRGAGIRGQQSAGQSMREQWGEARAEGQQGGKGMGQQREGRSEGEGMRGEGRGQQASVGNGENQGGGTRGEGRGQQGRNQAGGRGGKGGDRGPTLFVNPYTGVVLGEYDSHKSFFHFIEEIHRGLVAGRVGKLVMGINSIIFLFILGTGIVLWWPTARKALTQRLQIKWGSSWKRLNHDFHIVLGFYASVFLFIMASTGVGMSFDWVGKTINTLTHSPQQRPEPPTSAAAEPGTARIGADAALAFARQQAPDAESYAVQLPREPTGSIQVSTLRPGAITERATDDAYLDQYSGQVLRQQAYKQKPVGQRIRGLFKPIHTGAIFGWPTKILALVFVLLGATFPITGTIMWLNRTRKSKKKGQPRVVVA
ncbi:MAG: PepSY domain-containing protein [Cytophagaceae bacterium]|nr:MAG: PepSY domain-containing protein [Cytophagaceae bacterium]